MFQRPWMLAALLAVLALSAGVPAPVCACSCAIDPHREALPAALRRSDAVFRGTVVRVNGTLSRWTGTPVSVTFAVSQVWKGPEQEQLMVNTGVGDGDCGIPFQVGQEYLVYAYDGDHPLTGSGLAANSCSRTAMLADAQADLAALGRGVVPPPDRDAGAGSAAAGWLLALLAGVCLLALALLVRRSKATTPHSRA